MRVSDLVVHRGNHCAVNGLSFTAKGGQVTALLGPNGAGKTTTIETCEGFHKPTAGMIEILGKNPAKDHTSLAPQVGVMLQEGGVPYAAKPMQALSYMAALYQNPLDYLAIAKTLGLESITSTYRRMSGGEQQRLKFAIAIIGRPAVVFLDEPTAGMDISARNTIWQIIHQLREAGVCVILTTHQMEDVERLADKIVLIADGKLVAEGTPTEFTQHDQANISFTAPVGTDFSELACELATGVTISEIAPGSYQISASSDVSTLALLTNWCVSKSIPLSNVATNQQRLADVISELNLAGRQDQ